MKRGDRVAVSPTFPPEKARINNISVGDAGTVVSVYDDKIALVDWDKGFRTTANVCDLDKAT